MAKLDQVMDAVLDVLIATEGEFRREPGEVLKALAEVTGYDYFAVAHAVLRLERLGFVCVERWDRPDAHRANKLVAVSLCE